MSATYGIDFGTTNSVLARASFGTVEVVPLDEPPGAWAQCGLDKVLPSVIGFDGEEPTFGWKAKAQHRNRLEAVKRLFATEDDEVTIGMHSLHVEEVAAMLFRHMQQRAVAMGVMEPLDAAVVTVPANSRGKARYRTKLSAGLAGIEVMALINEPTAAAMAHARAVGENERILVFDWGGGTLDVTVLQAVEGTFIEQASRGIQRLGGVDIDTEFFQAGKDLAGGSEAWSDIDRGKFRLNLELAKIQLSSQSVTQLLYPNGQSREVTRSDFEQAIRPIIERTREPVQICLRDSPGAIDHLVMVGGSSKMPIAKQFVSDLCRADVRDDIDPMTAIAEGAAIAAGILSGTITDVDFFVATEHALGVVASNDYDEQYFSVLIRRNTKLPARATDSYFPHNDFQETVDLRVIEGDPDKPLDDDENVVLRNWIVELPEPRPRVEAGFEVTYEYDVDGILHVEVVDQKTSTVMMDELLTFYEGEKVNRLRKMRGRVDRLMLTNGSVATNQPSGHTLSSESLALIVRARDKMLPFVSEGDEKTLSALIAALEESSSGEESTRRDALQREMRNHAYLL